MIIQPSKKNKEIPKIHKEISELEQKLIERRKKLIEKTEADKRDKELIREIIKERVEIPKPTKVKPVVPLAAKKVVIRKAKELKGEKKERQIKLLTDLAFEKGVIHATEVAEKLDDPYILDEFHDTLVDELYDYLVKQKKLKAV